MKQQFIPSDKSRRKFTNMKEPTGFVNRTDSIIDENSVVDAERLFILQINPASNKYEWYRWGKRFGNTQNERLTFSDTEGQHYFYYDENGNLVDNANPTFTAQQLIFAETPLVSVIYWDSANNETIYLAEERHGINMSGDSHVWKHFKQGTIYLSGLALGDFDADGTGNDDTNSQFSCADGIIKDEDIQINITDDDPQDLDPIIYIPVFYKTGAGGLWRREWTEDTWQAATAYSLGDRIVEDNSYWEVTVAGTSGGVEPTWSGSPTPGDTIVDNTVTWTNVGTPRSATRNFVGGSYRLAWNEFTGGAWQQTEVGNVQFVLSHIYATNDVRLPIIAIQGQATYGSIAAAQAGATTEINNLITAGLPFVEFIPIGTTINQTGTTYTNESKSKIVSTADSEDYVNWIGQELSPTIGPSNHNNLASLQGGTAGEYYHLTEAQHTETTDWFGAVTAESTGKLTIAVPTTTTEALILQTTDDDATKNIFEVKDSGGNLLYKFRGQYADETYPRITIGGTNTSIAWVFNRRQSGADIYFGESNDTGSTIFRGTGGLEANGQVAGGLFEALHLENNRPNSTSNTVRLNLAAHDGFDQGASNSPYIESGNESTNGGYLAFGVHTASALIEPLKINRDGSTVFTSQNTAIVPLAVKAAPFQTANLTEWQNSGGIVLANVEDDGAIGIGLANGLTVDTKLQILGSNKAYGAFISNTGITSGSKYGMLQQVTAATGTASNFTGGWFDAFLSQNLSVTNVRAGEFSIRGTSGTIGNAYAIDAYITNSGAITNAYGLRIQDVSAGTSSNYAIYTNAGDVRFGDKVIFTQTDGNEYIDSLADGYMDYGATTAHRFNANIEIADGKDMVFNTTTGTKIGTATNQKLGFFNATPVVQQSHIVDADGTLADITTKFNTLLSQLEAYGLLATS